jgi:hypothetical protein
VAKVLRRKKSLQKIVNSNGSIISNIYCRRCMKEKPYDEFYSAADLELDKNGYFSICKTCVGELYVISYNLEHSIQRAIYRVCKIINLVYSEAAMKSVESQLSSKEKLPDDPKIFSLYKSRVFNAVRGSDNPRSVGKETLDMTFKYETATIPKREESIDFDGMESIVDFWGGNGQFVASDYRYLEQEFANFKRTHKIDTYSEVILLKEVCYKLLNIRKKIDAGSSSTAGEVKELQELMKNLAISPNMANQASGGKNLEAFGVWLEQIEHFKPSEYFQDKSIYRDVDNIEEYGRKYFEEPCKTFMLQSPDFSTEELEKMLDDEVTTEG